MEIACPKKPLSHLPTVRNMIFKDKGVLVGSRDFHIAKYRTRNSKRGTRNAERETRNAEHETWNAEHGTRNAERGTRNAERGTRNTERGTRNIISHAAYTSPKHSTSCVYICSLPG